MAVASSSIPERAVNGHRPARVPPDEPAPAAANETERALLAAARAGDFFDPLGSTAPTSEVATGWGGGSVRARFLVALLTSPDAGVHRLGVRATGIRITETLDLRAAKLLVPLDLNGCRLTRGPRLDDASGSFIAVRGCTVTHGGLEAARLHLDGSLDLSRTSFRSRVSLHDAHIGADLICHHTRFRRGASTEALYAPGITVDADVLLDGSTATGCVDLSQARIERSLHARCVSYSCRTAPAMRLRGVHVGGEVDCAGATVSAPVDAIEARGLEAGIVSFDPCFDEKLTDGAPRAMTARGCLSFRHATITAFRARGACLRRPAAAAHRDREQALNLTGAKVAGDVDLGPAAARRTTVWGRVCLAGAELSGDLLLAGAQITRAGSVAVDAHGMAGCTVSLRTATLRARETARFLARGAVLFTNATMEELNCRGARLICPGGIALDAVGATIKRKVVLDRALDDYDRPIYVRGSALRFHATGAVDLQEIKTGQVLCRGGLFDNAAGYALVLYAAEVSEQVLLEAAIRPDGRPIFTSPRGRRILRMTARGTVLLQNATIGHLSCRGACLHAPDAGSALDARNVTIRGDVLLDVAKMGGSAELHDLDGPVAFVSDGEVTFTGAEIEGTMNCEHAHLNALEPSSDSARRSTAFDASMATIGRKLVWKPAECQGSLDLRGLAVGALEDTVANWDTGGDGRLKLDGFTYAALLGGDARKWKKRRDDWLAKSEYATQPYQQLAAVYRTAGDSHAARKIAMALFNAQLKPAYLKAHPPGRSPLRILRILGRWILRLFIGHGYEPLRAVIPVVALLLLGYYVTIEADQAGQMVRARPAAASTGKSRSGAAEPRPQDCGRKDYPCLQPLLYAADLLVPVVDLGQRDAWRPTGDYRWLAPVMAALGWALTTLIVAGFTGLVRRE